MVEKDDAFYRETNGFYKPQVSDGVERDNIGRPKAKPLPTDQNQPVHKPLMDNREKFEKQGVPFLKEVKENKEARKIAKENGVHVGSNFWHEFLIIFFVFIVIGGICFVSWGIYNDKFKTEVSVNTTCPDIEIPACPSVEIPECPICESTCEVTCPEFPNEINVILQNGTG